MSDTLSFSIFTIEADRKPLLAFASPRKYQEAEAFCADERVRTKLTSVRSGGVPLCDDCSILRVRWQSRTRGRVTTIKRRRNRRLWKTSQRSSSSIWTQLNRPENAIEFVQTTYIREIYSRCNIKRMFSDSVKGVLVRRLHLGA